MSFVVGFYPVASNGFIWKLVGGVNEPPVVTEFSRIFVTQGRG